jgi:hypothetical protein
LWYTPVVPALRRLRQENCEFQASLDYIVKPCLKKNKTNKTKKKGKKGKCFSDSYLSFIFSLLLAV